MRQKIVCMFFIQRPPAALGVLLVPEHVSSLGQKKITVFFHGLNDMFLEDETLDKVCWKVVQDGREEDESPSSSEKESSPSREIYVPTVKNGLEGCGW